MTTTETTQAADTAEADNAVREFAAAVSSAVASAQANPDAPNEDHLPEGYLLVVALRVSDQPCDQCGDEDSEHPHTKSELAVLNRMDPEQALSVLASAMRHIGDRYGIDVEFADPRRLMAAMAAMAAMGGRMPGGPAQDEAADADARTGQYL